MGAVLKTGVAVTALYGLFPQEGAQAVDFTGAWASDADNCKQMFMQDMETGYYRCEIWIVR